MPEPLRQGLLSITASIDRPEGNVPHRLTVRAEYRPFPDAPAAVDDYYVKEGEIVVESVRLEPAAESRVDVGTAGEQTVLAFDGVQIVPDSGPPPVQFCIPQGQPVIVEYVETLDPSIMPADGTYRIRCRLLGEEASAVI